MAPGTVLPALWGGCDRGWGIVRREPRGVAAPRPTGRSLALRRHRRGPRPTFQARRQPRSRPAAGSRCGRLLAFGDAAGLGAGGAGAGAPSQEPSPGAWLRSGRVAGRRRGAAAARSGCSRLLGSNATDVAARRSSESVSSDQRDRRLRRAAAGAGARASGGSRRRCLHVGRNDAAMRPPTARRGCARGGGVGGLPKLSSSALGQDDVVGGPLVEKALHGAMTIQPRSRPSQRTSQRRRAGPSLMSRWLERECRELCASHKAF